MKLAHLKIVRVVVSLVFFLLTGLLFLGISDLSQRFADLILILQFIPSFLHFLIKPFHVAGGFILIIILTVLFGRVYCSTICPLGTFLDIIIFIKSKIFKKKKFKFKKSHNILRYSILAITGISLIFGTVLIVNLFDPYSNFGRIFSNFVRPLYITINNVFASVLEDSDFALKPLFFKGWKAEILLYPIIFIIVVTWLSVKHGRLYCNTICPVGSLLGLFSKLSLFKIVINTSSCKQCGLCEKACKAECICNDTMEVDFSRCVSCFNCFRACNLNGFKYKFSYSPKNVILPTETDISKRNFIFTTSAFVFGLFSGLLAQTKTIIVTKASTIRENKKNEVLPPGAKSFEHFTSKCTACHLCVSICCNQVLQPSFFELGAASIMQPRMDYHIGFCNYECNDCSKVCPTGAILPVDLSYKKRIQLGKSKFIKDNCIVITEKTECGACSEHCPTKAVKMVPYKGLFLPEVKEKICIGCGACEFACPTMPYKAIYVEGNPVHVTADKPEEKQYILNVTGKQLQQNALKNKMEKIKQEQDTKQKDDFPF